MVSFKCIIFIFYGDVMYRNNRIRNNKIKKKNMNIFNDKKIIKFLSFLVIFLIALLAVVATVYYFHNLNNNSSTIQTSSNDFNSTDSSENNLNKTDHTSLEDSTSENLTFNLAVIGDVMCHNTQYIDAYDKNTGEYDFSYVFDDISFYTKTADITVGSLETTFAGEDRGYSNYPNFNSPDALAYSLKDIGVDVLSTAGNHALDMGFSGLSRTIDVLNDADISHLGTYKSQEERDKILIKYVKGIKIAFINYTYGVNGNTIPSDKSYCVNLIDKDLIKKDIDAAKQENADIIIACMHWGTEYKTYANSEQKDLADFLFQNGVDIILGNHPHVLEPMEKRTVTLEDRFYKRLFCNLCFR